jgi:hypothetical protein
MQGNPQNIIVPEIRQELSGRSAYNTTRARGVRLRLWPQKRWKKIVLATFLTIIVVGAILLAYVLLSINKDVVSPVYVINAGGSKTALVVYQPGLTSSPKDNSYAFADGLASSGWRVEITTASSQAPSDLSNYSLLVLAFPIYGGGTTESFAPLSPFFLHVHENNNIQISRQFISSEITAMDKYLHDVDWKESVFYSFYHFFQVLSKSFPFHVLLSNISYLVQGRDLTYVTKRKF